MTERALLTSREAALTSLLLHACLVIVVLLFPGMFSLKRDVSGTDPEERSIPVAFHSPPDDAIEKQSFLGDSGEGRRSDPRQAEASAPQNVDPFAEGNTPNRFLAPLSPRPPSPDEGSGAVPDTGQAASSATERPTDAALDPDESQGDDQATRNDGRLGNPGDAVGAEEPKENENGGQYGGNEPPDRPSLRETLGRMSAGGGAPGGGSSLRYDNPRGGLSGPQGGLSFETSDYDWGPYARRIYWVIYNNWIRSLPPAAWAGFKGMVTVKFRIQRDGRITGIEVTAPSGTPAYDRCATVALEASDPLPPLPPDFWKTSEGITARFIYDVEAWSR